MKILLAITFVYGVIYMLTHTKLFNTTLTGIVRSIIPAKEGTFLSSIEAVIYLLDNWFFYFSLIFQTYYWLFK